MQYILSAHKGTAVGIAIPMYHPHRYTAHHSGWSLPFYAPIRYGNRRFHLVGGPPMASMVQYVNPPAPAAPATSNTAEEVVAVLAVAGAIAAVAHWGFHLGWLAAAGIGLAVPAAAWLVVAAAVAGSQKGV